MRQVKTQVKLTDAELQRLAIFPLPRQVLFPNTLCPLHVFEPRYRRLVEHCLDRSLPMAVWQIDPRARRTEFGPGIRRVATAGRIRIHHHLPDGRLNLVVEGLERVRLLEEMESEDPYRIVRTVRHPMSEVASDEVGHRIEALHALSDRLAFVHGGASRLVRLILMRHEDPSELSDVLCSATFEDAAVRQGLLEQSSVPRRLDLVIERLSALVLGGRSGPDAEPGPDAP